MTPRPLKFPSPFGEGDFWGGSGVSVFYHTTSSTFF